MVGFLVDHVEPENPRPFIGAWPGGMIQFEQKEGSGPANNFPGAAHWAFLQGIRTFIHFAID